MTCGWTGVCRLVFRKVPSSNYRNLRSYPVIPTFMMNFGGKPPFFAIFRQFLDNPPLFMENLPKKGPLFREFGAQKPTHMGGTYPYLQHVMYPPGRLPIKYALNLRWSVPDSGGQVLSSGACSQRRHPGATPSTFGSSSYSPRCIIVENVNQGTLIFQNIEGRSASPKSVFSVTRPFMM